MGETFDPERHEAISMIPVTDPAQDNLVVQELKQGARVGEKVVRPATVIVGRYDAKAPPAEALASLSRSRPRREVAHAEVVGRCGAVVVDRDLDAGLAGRAARRNRIALLQALRRVADAHRALLTFVEVGAARAHCLAAGGEAGLAVLEEVAALV
ncbi:MAG: nucleotide exchange factor GrpE [Deltaproteobacteria bacterium]|nr:nucleotide exchange factor GrpE [Deltaproteobacteria bacterium]